MSAVENTVFISYRRNTSSFIARAMFMDLRDHSYDVFMDVESINAGEFEGIILRQIAARAHFLMILAPGTLERCQNPEDWVRRELEEAIRLKRNIIPILVNEFRFKDEEKYLTGTLAVLPKYNALTLHHDYFDAGMEKLRTRFLKVPVQVNVADTPKQDEPVVQQKIEEVARQPRPDEAALSAEEWLSKGNEKYDKKDFTGAIADYTEAIRLNPQYAIAYYNRGVAKEDLGDTQAAIADYDEAIRLNPQYAAAYNNRGNAKDDLKDTQGAIADYTEAIRLNPQYAAAYNNRGLAKRKLGDTQGAIADYTEAIRLNPQFAEAYNNRGIAKIALRDYQGAIADCTEAIHLNPQYADAYSNRGFAKAKLDDYKEAIIDFTKAVGINTRHVDSYVLRGLMWEALRDYQKALADYDAALKIKPDSENAKRERDNLLKKMKK